MFDPIPGKVAEVVLDNKHRGGPIFYNRPDTVTFVGAIEEPVSWCGPDRFQMHAGDDARPEFMFRVIRKDRVLSLRYIDGSTAVEVNNPISDVPEVIKKEVLGSKGKIYTVQYDKNGWSCTCPGFSFRGKCKHTDVQVTT